MYIKFLCQIVLYQGICVHKVSQSNGTLSGHFCQMVLFKGICVHSFSVKWYFIRAFVYIKFLCQMVLYQGICLCLKPS